MNPKIHPTPTPPPSRIPAMDGARERALSSGVKTSEFWLMIALTVAALAGDIAGAIPFAHSGPIAGICGAVYAIMRTTLKWKGMGAQFDEIEDLRRTVRDEIQVAMAKRATPAERKEGE